MASRGMNWSFLFWICLFTAAGTINVHIVLAILLVGEGTHVTYDHVIAIPVVIVVVMIVMVLIATLNGRRHTGEIVGKQRARYGKWFNWPFVGFLMGLTWFFFTIITNPFDGFPIIVLSLIVYWLVKNKERVPKKRAFTAILLMEAVFMAIVPVIVDRSYLRSETSSIIIVRDVPGNASNDIIQSIEGFNASKNYNWSSNTTRLNNEFFFDGQELALHSAQITRLMQMKPEPILYRPAIYGKLVYILNGTIAHGNISTMFTNSTIKLLVNGTMAFDSNHSLQGYYEQYQFMNATVFSKPVVNETIVNCTSGYLISLGATYETPCAWFQWRQWYFLKTPDIIAWLIAGSEIEEC